MTSITIENRTTVFHILWLLFLAVPLSSVHPLEMWEYFVKDSGSKILVTTSEYEKKMKSLSEKLGLPLIVVEEDLCKQGLIKENEVCFHRSELLFIFVSDIVNSDCFLTGKKCCSGYVDERRS